MKGVEGDIEGIIIVDEGVALEGDIIHAVVGGILREIITIMILIGQIMDQATRGRQEVVGGQAMVVGRVVGIGIKKK